MSTIRIFNTVIEVIPALVIMASIMAIAALSNLATDTSSHWYTKLNRPTWQPSARLLGRIWSVLYILIATSAIIGWTHSVAEYRTALMLLFAINGIFNVAWGWIFFRGHTPFWAGIAITSLWVTIILLMTNLWPISPTASLMLIPYFLWVSYAMAINWAIVRMNTVMFNHPT